MKPFYCRIGSKSRIVKTHLLPLIPEHKTYVEPFAGSAALLWGKKPSLIEIINDLDTNLIQDYKLIHKSPNTINIPNLTDMKQYNDFYEHAPNTPNNKIIKALMRRCGTFAGKQEGKIWKFSPKSTKLKNFDKYKQRFNKVKIFNKSYEKMFEMFDSPDTFFYLDPPYENSTAKVGQYKDIDLVELKNRLFQLKGKWLLSINDSPNIRKIFKGTGVKIKSFTMKPQSFASSVGKTERKELLIKNY